MPITTSCTGCKVTLKVPDTAAGKAIKCPKCNAVFKVAANGAAPAAAPAAAAAKPAAAPAKTAPSAPKPAAAPAAGPAAPAVPKPAAGAVARTAPAVKPAPAAKAAPASVTPVSASLKTDKPAAKPPAPLEPIEPLEPLDEIQETPPKKAGKKVEEEPLPIEEDEDEDRPRRGGKQGKADDKTPLEVDKDDPFEGLDVPDDMQKDIRGELTKKEKIRWVGRPDQEMAMSKAKIARPIGAGVVVLGLIVMIVMMIAMEGGLKFLGLIPGVFLGLIGTLCILAPMLTAKFAHKRAVYLITNRRAMTYGDYRGGNKVEQWSPIQMRKMQRKDSSYWPGCGSLVFETRTEMKSGAGTRSRQAARAGYRSSGSQTVDVPIGFIDIRDVKKIERFLRDTLIDTVTDKLLNDEKPVKKEDEDEDEVPDIIDPNEKMAPGVRARKKDEDEEDDPNVKSAPGAKPAKKKQAEEEPEELEEVGDDNVKSAPGVKSKGKGKARDEDEDANVRTVKRGGEDLPESEDVPEQLRDMVDGELSGKEKLLWIGQPHPKLAFMRALMPGLGACFFALIFGTIFAVVGFGGSGGVLFGIIGVLVVLGVGGGSIAYPFFRRAMARHSVYAVTNKRCLVYQANFFGKPQLTIYNPEELVNLFRRDAWFVKQAGDVVFRTRTVITTTRHYTQSRRGGPSSYRGSSTSVRTYYYGFIGISNAREVEHLIRETLVDPIVDKLTTDDDD